MPESLEHFLSTAVNAGTMKIEGEDDPKDLVDTPHNVTRPDTESHGRRTKVPTKTKKTTKKKTTVARAPAGVEKRQNTEHVMKTPTQEEIDAAKAVLARADAGVHEVPTAEQIGVVAQQMDENKVEDKDRFLVDRKTGEIISQGEATPESTADIEDPPSHTSVAEQFQITDIDDELPPKPQPPVAAEEDGKPVTPKHLVEHACGLPACLLGKRQITAYLTVHSVDHTARKRMTFSGEEKVLYEVYTQMQKMRRVSFGHFVACLRLWRDGRYAVNPKASVNLDAMKIGE